ncbi:MAG: alpha/beta hydrolase fold domain-containing protein [Bacteroidota bacterium]
MKKICLIVFLATSLMACAQTPQDTLTYKEIMDLAYRPAEEITVDSLQRLNLVIPEGVENPPLLLWIGGGAWSFVNRHMEMNLARQLAKRGVAVASVGHLLSMGSFGDSTRTHGVKHPAHIKDIAAAFHWLHQHGPQYGYDANNIFVGGFSSGAHLAALLAMDEKYLKKYKLSNDDIRAIIPIAGTYEIKAYYDVFANHESARNRELARTHVMDVFGEDIEGFAEASPATYLDQLDIPMLLISEGGLFEYTQLFEKMIWESEYRECQILHVLDKGHASLWREMSFSDNSQTRNAVVDYIHLKKKVESSH